jgi:hypothetical protein
MVALVELRLLVFLWRAATFCPLSVIKTAKLKVDKTTLTTRVSEITVAAGA